MTIFVNKFLLFLLIGFLSAYLIGFFIKMKSKQKEIDRLYQKLKDEDKSREWDNF